MKSRQEKIKFPKVNKEKDLNSIKKDQKNFEIKRDLSYECILKQSFVNENEIPKVIIRKKKDLTKKSKTEIKENNENSNEISFSQLLESVSKNEFKSDKITLKNNEKLNIQNENEINLVENSNSSSESQNVTKSKKVKVLSKDKKISKSIMTNKNKKNDVFDLKKNKISPINDNIIFVNHCNSNKSSVNSIEILNTNIKRHAIVTDKSDNQKNFFVTHDSLELLVECDKNKLSCITNKEISENIKSDNIENKLSNSKSLANLPLNKESIAKKLNSLSHGILNFNKIFNNFLSKVDPNSSECWNDLYAPKSIDDFVTESHGEVSKLKKWLNEWKLKNNKESLIKKAKYSDDSDYDYKSSDSSYSKKIKSTCIIIGPTGVGKTALVYAIGKELNYKVLEMNCSSRRTGKDVLSTLLASTHSKQVNISQIKSNVIHGSKEREMHTPLNSNNEMKFFPILKRQHSEMSVINDSLLLFDDADIVMDEDAGFWGAIYSLIKKKTRPIILTCSDEKEANKFLSKYSKISYFKINLLMKEPETIVSYLQTVLLSRNQISNQSEMLMWIMNLHSINLRSAINNLHFDSILYGINYKVSFHFSDWTQFKKDCFVKDFGVNAVIKETDIKKDNNSNKSKDTLKAIKPLSSLTNMLSSLDSLRRKERITKIAEKYFNINTLINSNYDSFKSMSEDIDETLITLYNSNQSRLLERCDDELLSPLLVMPQSKVVVHSNYPRKLNNIRSVVSGTHDNLDRISALRTMCAAENIRRNNKYSRRFTHYFDRRNLDISKADQIYLSTPFNK